MSAASLIAYAGLGWLAVCAGCLLYLQGARP